MDELSEDDKLTVARARKIQRFLSQPFQVAEVFTGHDGKLVPLPVQQQWYSLSLSLCNWEKLFLSMETDGCVLVEASKFLREKWFGAKLLKITVVCLHLETYRLLLQHFLNFFFPFVRTLSQDSRKSFMVGWTTCILKKSEFVFLLYLHYTKHVWKGSVLFWKRKLFAALFQFYLSFCSFLNLYCSV